jgi:hypothetical protein
VILSHLRANYGETGSAHPDSGATICSGLRYFAVGVCFFDSHPNEFRKIRRMKVCTVVFSRTGWIASGGPFSLSRGTISAGTAVLVFEQASLNSVNGDTSRLT